MALLLALALLVQQPGAHPGLIPDDPPFELPRGVRDSVRFAWLEVPMDHAEPSGPRLRLALTLLPARGADPAPDPIVYLPGGPGGSATRETEAFARSARIGLYRERRTVILLDPRGHGLSEPIVCTELNGAEPLLEASEPAEILWLRKLDACGKRVRAEGMRLETLAAAQVALDLELLRRALGVPALNLIGGSYGTRLAAEAMGRVPATIRAVNLVGPVPPDARNLEDADARASESLSALLRRCGERAECRAAYPRLSSDLAALLAAARREPLVLRVPRSSAAPDGRLVLTEKVLREGLSQLASDRDLAAGAPLLIHAAAADGGALLARVAPQLMRVFSEADLSAATKTAFRCNDAPLASGGAALFRRRCAALLGSVPDERNVAPLRSDIPTLVLSGEIDPRTPPSYARRVVRGLSHGVYVEIPWTGHDRPPDCAIRITAAFFEDPGRAPAATCMDSVPPITFVSGVVPNRWVGGAVSQAVRRPLPVGASVASVLGFLLLPIVGLPVWHLRARRVGRRRPARDAAVLWAGAALGLVLLGGAAAAVLAGMREHVLIPAVGVPSGWRWVLILPWLLPVAAAAAVATRAGGGGEASPPPLLRWAAMLGVGMLLAFWLILSLTG